MAWRGGAGRSGAGRSGRHHLKYAQVYVKTFQMLASPAQSQAQIISVQTLDLVLALSTFFILCSFRAPHTPCQESGVVGMVTARGSIDAEGIVGGGRRGPGVAWSTRSLRGVGGGGTRKINKGKGVVWERRRPAIGCWLPWALPPRPAPSAHWRSAADTSPFLSTAARPGPALPSPASTRGEARGAMK